ncbi:MAG: hypothetical protein AB7Q97_12400 [Gammaproteobacteria bacterium]
MVSSVAAGTITTSGTVSPAIMPGDGILRVTELYIAHVPNSVGSVELGDAAILQANFIDIGNASNSTGTLLVGSGSSASASLGIEVGEAPGAHATLEATGAGSRIESGHFLLGGNTGSTAHITARSGGSISASGMVGIRNGTLNVLSGGVLTVNAASLEANPFQQNTALIRSLTPGSRLNVNVVGDGSRIQFVARGGAPANTFVGGVIFNNSTGDDSLSVQDGGSISGSVLAIDGRFDLDGPGSRVDLTRDCDPACDDNARSTDITGFFLQGRFVARTGIISNGGVLNIHRDAGEEGVAAAWIGTAVNRLDDVDQLDQSTSGFLLFTRLASNASLTVTGSGSSLLVDTGSPGRDAELVVGTTANVSMLDGDARAIGGLRVLDGGLVRVTSASGIARTLVAGTPGDVATIDVDGDGSLLDAGDWFSAGILTTATILTVYPGAADSYMHGISTGVGGVAHVNVAQGGELRADQIRIGANSVLTGSGTLTGNVGNSGTLLPGNSSGTMHINGDLVLDDSSVTIIEIGPAEHDFIDVTGTLTLGGHLKVMLLGGFVPSSNDPLTFLLAAKILGSFSSIELPVVAGKVFDVEFSASAASLSAVPLPAGVWLFACALTFMVRIRRLQPGTL